MSMNESVPIASIVMDSSAVMELPSAYSLGTEYR